MSKTFRPGDTVYNEFGQAVDYVAKVHDGHVVRSVYEHEEDARESWYGGVMIERVVFSEPPTPRFDKSTKEAQAALDQARAELQLARTELAAIQRQQQEAVRTLENHPDVRPLVAFLEGRITHLAFVSNYGSDLCIKPIAEALTPEDASDAREGMIRLLALYGGYTGPAGTKNSYRADNLSWRLSRYSDGSGNDSKICFLGTSEADAKEQLQAYVQRQLKSNSQSHNCINLAASAIQIGLIVPPEWMQEVTEYEQRAKANALENARKELARAQELAARYSAVIADHGAEAA
ncbi:hypothetical protein M0D45_00895 [Xanthomonas prunicola]|uniref:hypothetical protein n=1 Tax=Xanthomonas prunicola TaxID=2053930 RepID=UPI0021B18A70|nr:hypothetical protein [Xanthomonas prunicola]UXA53398.1 hypothetical protein M0D45_00895 [Xanthomonas prunicola]